MKTKPLHELSETELAELVANAQKELKDRQSGKRKDVLAKIKALAASIGITVELGEANGSSTRKGSKVAVKYRNPENHAEAWTGRGVKPRWLKALLDQGKDLKDFEV